MMFVVWGSYAQTNESVEEQLDTLSFVSSQPAAYVDNDLTQTSSILTNLAQKMLEDDTVDSSASYLMIGGTRVEQMVEISTITGKDKDLDTGTPSDISNGKEIPDVISNLNFGMNIGYSAIFIPGKVRDAHWAPNPLGFAYLTGFIASFDRQDTYNVTCDFLWKVGVESGNGHALGVGLDLLLGGGKTAGTTLYCPSSEEGVEKFPYTIWCWKQGAQVWIKTNLLTTNIENTDLLVFARFVHSIDPQKDVDFEKKQLINQWIEESWQFGVTLRYRF